MQENSYEFGRAFEHFFLLEIIRLNHYHRLDLDLSFYRTERGAEVDCIIETPARKIIAIEIKASAHPSSTMLTGLKSFKEKVSNARLILACRVERPQVIKDITVLPWQDALELIHSEA